LNQRPRRQDRRRSALAGSGWDDGWGEVDNRGGVLSPRCDSGKNMKLTQPTVGGTRKPVSKQEMYVPNRKA